MSNEELTFNFENFRIKEDINFKAICKSLNGNCSNQKPKFDLENKNSIKIQVNNPVY